MWLRWTGAWFTGWEAETTTDGNKAGAGRAGKPLKIHKENTSEHPVHRTCRLRWRKHNLALLDVVIVGPWDTRTQVSADRSTAQHAARHVFTHWFDWWGGAMKTRLLCCLTVNCFFVMDTFAAKRRMTDDADSTREYTALGTVMPRVAKC